MSGLTLDIWSEVVWSEVVCSVAARLENHLAWTAMSSLNLDVGAGALARQSDLRCPV